MSKSIPMLLPLVLLVPLLTGSLRGGVVECSVPYAVMYAIGVNERHRARTVGYPYLISVNRKADRARVAAAAGRDLFLDRRTLDCRSRDRCVETLRKILDAGVEDLDLGPFQINYRWHKHPLGAYFDLAESYKIACDIVAHLRAKFGWSWDTVGRYHAYSDRPASRNLRQAYVRRLVRTVEHLKAEKGE